MKVYIVTAGDYSEYHILGATLDRAEAERYIELYKGDYSDYVGPPEIEEWELGDIKDRHKIIQLVTFQKGEWKASWVDQSQNGWFNGNDDFGTYVFADDKGLAIKIAQDRLAQLKAERAGI